MLLPEGKERDKAFAECAERIANRDPETALAWVLGQPEERMERLMLPAMLDKLSGDEMLAALQGDSKIKCGR